jgi:hypothetical protein
MIRRLFWLVAGIAIGAWGSTKAHRAARGLTPEGIAETAVDRAARLGGRFRRFTDDVRAGMAEREAELKQTGERRGAPRDNEAGYAEYEAAYDQGLPGRRPGRAHNRKDDH